MRRCYDDPGAGPSHAAPTEVDGELRSFVTDWGWYYREYLRACGLISRMRESWSSVWAFWQSHRP
jgi:hypothetical protein